ncbi:MULTISPECIES: GTP-binding protein [Kitasatospora]|uniref:GTP-binding protein n=1 Tax=Kitasatospora TaxID=2063 RepID=UPI000C279E87|nr:MULTISPECIES: ATP/GTP-binding protein [Kitasatospora]PJN23471.1 ATP-binding protein [Kitasatospora sp. CB02891]
MDSAPSSSTGSSPVYLPATDPILMKLMVTGPFGVGKTTFVRSLSEIPTLHTEETMTAHGVPVDDISRTPGKTATTVAVDFGRLTLPAGDLVLYLFGTPGQRRFLPLWEDLARGALGALILADTRRLADAFDAMDLIEEAGLPYTVAVNRFPDTPPIELDKIRAALDLDPATPLIECDARERAGCLDALIALTEHVLDRLPQETAP